MPALSPFVSVALGPNKRPVVVPAHQQVSAEFAPKYLKVVPDTTCPQAWQGAETWVEFSLPREMGILENMRLEVNVEAPSFPGPVPDTTITAALMPTPFWLSRVEYYWGADLVETIYGEDAFHEVVGFQNQDAVNLVSESLNLSRGSAPGYTENGDGVSSGKFYIPLQSHLTTMKPFVRGFDAIIKVRCYFAPTIESSYVTGNPHPQLKDPQLILCEENLSRAEMDKVERLHKTGVVQYAGIFRERQSDSLTFSNSATTASYLRSFKHDSAGFLVYLKNQGASDNSNNLQLVEIKDIALQDAVGNKLTEQLSSDFLKYFVFPDHFQSNFTQTDEGNVYLIPFSSSMSDSIRTGNCFGKRALTSQERLQITPLATGNFVTNVVSYTYGYIVCKGGKHYVHMVSTMDEKNKSW